MERADVVVIGGGIVGLATAWQLQQRKPDLSVVVLEKEPEIASHQTGHNSGVLHTGIYYTPGSSKARNCTAGRAAMVRFCEEHDIPYEICGKVIVATREDELTRLDNLFERAQRNGVRSDKIGPERLAEIEPHATGIQALHVPDAGIVDFAVVARTLGSLLRDGGTKIHTSTRMIAARERGGEVVVETTAGDFVASRAINCGGLHSDQIAHRSGARPRVRIVPFRGEYYEFAPDSPRLCRHLIYPVPDPAFPFLGVHLTRTIGGKIEVGPNAVLAFSREGYTKLSISIADLAGTLTYSGFLRLAARHWRAGAFEMWRSISKRAFVGALQRLVPTVRSEHLRKAPAGVRAQAISPDGRMVDDFLIEETERIVHVCNAPSPAATASLNIGAALADRLL
jgi:L-2-hydroxyglutarate oxidase